MTEQDTTAADAAGQTHAFDDARARDAAAAQLDDDPGNPAPPDTNDPSNDGETVEQRETRERRNRPGRLERQLALAQRERDEARHYAQQAEMAARAYAQQLAEAQEAGNRVAVDGMQQRIALAEDQLRQAIHAGDTDAVVKAQSTVSRMHAIAAQIANAPRPAPPPVAPQRAPDAPAEYTDTTRAWLDANPWYGRDRQLTQLAKAVHAQAERAGHAVDSPEYWDFVESGIEAVAPGTVAGPDGDRIAVRPHTRTPPARGTAPTRTTAQTRPNATSELRLTADEADAAKISGLTPQEFKSWQAKLRAAGRITGAPR